ncbi:helix-turn-helix transcriptional regulator [Sodalis endosymbiont of Spalangia cameroni]|uniref:helix-turn-helix transcriptional regulator n=1 Tax=Sodalis praecaptivus TaxID=1239307 RepID=UPI0031F9023C
MNDILTYTCLHLTMPCAVTGNLGIPFFNQAMKALLNLPDRIDAEEMPLSLQLFLAQEEKARESGQFFSAQNRWPFGPEEKLQPYLFDFYPQFECVDDHPVDAEFECIGTICHARPFPFGSTLECVDGKAPRPATFEPGERFTPREWEIVFFALHNLSSKETGRRLGISHRTVENKLQDIYQKTGTHCNRGLAMYCRENGTDRYIPPSLLSPSSHVLNNHGAQ